MTFRSRNFCRFCWRPFLTENPYDQCCPAHAHLLPKPTPFLRPAVEEAMRKLGIPPSTRTPRQP